eukprot:gene12247-18921_t
MAISAERFTEVCALFAQDPKNRRLGWQHMEWPAAGGDPQRCYSGLAARDVPLELRKGKALKADVNVCWHQVYEVPVLCFVPYDETDAVVSFADLMEYLRFPDSIDGDAPILGLQPESVVSNGHHPVTNHFTLHLHPCETQSTLQAMGVTADSPWYIISFLSLVGPIIGMPLSMCQ